MRSILRSSNRTSAAATVRRRVLLVRSQQGQISRFPITTTRLWTSTQAKDMMESMRLELLQSALEHVHVHGWTQDAIAAAAADMDTASMAVAGLVQPSELVSFAMNHWNEQLKSDLQVQQDVWKQLDTPRTDRIQQALKTRLSYLLPYLQSQQWHHGMALGVKDPEQALQTRDQLKELIDIVVAAVMENEESLSDVQKLSLGGIYVATELHLLTDTSPDYQASWEFLRERVQDWERLVGDGSTDGSSDSLRDTLDTASALVSSLAGGVVSLIQPANVPSKLPEQVWSTLSSHVQPPSFVTNAAVDNAKDRDDEPVDGTSPSHYEAPSTSENIKK